MLAAKEATRIRLSDREAAQPLQEALERIADGKVKGKYLTDREMIEYDDKQRELREVAAARRERTIIPLPQLEEELKPKEEEE
mgnify:CR=1 FL=1